MTDSLQRWEYQLSAGFVVRGWMTRPTGKPVIHFVHGNGYCGLVYWQFLSHLQNDFDLFISDVQGHGGSDLGGRFHGWNRNADFIAECWHHFSGHWSGVTKIAMGHSFGAVLSTLAQAKYSNLFDKMILLDPVFFPANWARLLMLSEPFGLLKLSPLARRAKVRRSSWDSKEDAYAYFNGRGMFKGWQPQCLEDYIEHALRPAKKGLELRCPPEREAAIFGSFPKRLWAHIEKVNCPTDLIYGDDTYPFVKQSAHAIRLSHPLFRVHQVKGRHCFMQEFPEATASFVESLADLEKN
ncbi:MAG: alpha/beta hydrolase [Hahellaceae bacterium]|nr:alpha/beta hydrolase [Hahellaceae bacterium]